MGNMGTTETWGQTESFRIILSETVAEFEHRLFDVRKTSHLPPAFSGLPETC